MRQSCDYMIFKFPVTIIEMTFGVTNDIMRKIIQRGIAIMANDPQTALNLQINYFIISKLWDYENFRKPPDKRDNKEVFYELIGLSRNVYSRIICQDALQPVNLNNRWERKKNNKLIRLGLSKEIMTGKEQIVLDGISRDRWQEYFSVRKDKKDKSIHRTDFLTSFDKDLKKAFEKLRIDRRAVKPIDKLYYFIHTGTAIDDQITDFEIKELLHSLELVQILHWKECDPLLRQEAIHKINEQLKKANIIHEYQKL